MNHFCLRGRQSLGAPEGSGFKGLGGTLLPKLPLCTPSQGEWTQSNFRFLHRRSKHRASRKQG